MTSKTPDDFDAVRLIVEALKPFDPKDQERVIRWAREKLGLSSGQGTAAAHLPAALTTVRQHTSEEQTSSDRPKDIRSFVVSKNPQSDNQFAAAVAYYYRFEAPETERKMDITADDVQDATRRAGRDRLKSPWQTLVNAHEQGYFDKVDRGRYALSTVGENLVAMALPQATATAARRPARGKRQSSRKKR
jgi:hypothetical protein